MSVEIERMHPGGAKPDGGKRLNSAPAPDVKKRFAAKVSQHLRKFLGRFCNSIFVYDRQIVRPILTEVKTGLDRLVAEDRHSGFDGST